MKAIKTKLFGTAVPSGRMTDVLATLPNPERIAYAPCKHDKWAVCFYRFATIEALDDAIWKDGQKAPPWMGGDAVNLKRVTPHLPTKKA